MLVLSSILSRIDCVTQCQCEERQSRRTGQCCDANVVDLSRCFWARIGLQLSQCSDMHAKNNLLWQLNWWQESRDYSCDFSCNIETISWANMREYGILWRIHSVDTQQIAQSKCKKSGRVWNCMNKLKFSQLLPIWGIDIQQKLHIIFKLWKSSSTTCESQYFKAEIDLLHIIQQRSRSP